jgi:hypothetical protein
MSNEVIYERLLRIAERWGWPLVLSMAVLWFARVDVILPMVDAHSRFLEELTVSHREIARSQVEISRLVEDQARTLEAQTRILYAICPPSGKVPVEAREFVQSEEQ